MPKLLSIGELIDDSWDAYRQDFFSLMSISVWMLVIAFLYMVSLALNPLASQTISGVPLTGSETFGLGLYLFTKFIAAPVIGLWVFLALVRFVAVRATGARADVRTSIAEGRKLFWPAVLISILLALVLIGAILVSVGPSVIVGIIAAKLGSTVLGFVAAVLSTVGMLVAIGLVVKWSVEYGLWSGPPVYALCMDGQKSSASLTYTKSLVTGRFFGTLARVVIPSMVFVVIGTVAVGLPSYFLSVILVSATANNDVQLRMLSVISTVFPLIAAVLVNPIIVIANVLLYKSLKETKPMRLGR